MKLLTLCLVIFTISANVSCSDVDVEAMGMQDVSNLPEINGNKFLYFGYGSNMLSQRIHIQNPTAVRVGPGKLKDYRLDFNDFSTNWDGAPATVVPHENRTVQGTLWEIDLSNLDDIDNQEGVHIGMYEAKSIPITLLNSNKVVIARVYLLTDQPKTVYDELPVGAVPKERQPSKSYMQCLVKGAMETGLESEYITWLKSLKHNGVVAEKMSRLLGLENVELNS